MLWAVSAAPSAWMVSSMSRQAASGPSRTKSTAAPSIPSRTVTQSKTSKPSVWSTGGAPGPSGSTRTPKVASKNPSRWKRPCSLRIASRRARKNAVEGKTTAMGAGQPYSAAAFGGSPTRPGCNGPGPAIGEGRSAMAYIITRLCRDCLDTGCVAVCPVDCIYEYTGTDREQFPNQLYIHPEECIDCGACEPECPWQAIFEEVGVPADFKVAQHRKVEHPTAEQIAANKAKWGWSG